MPEPVRLSKRVVELTGCSRNDAEQYIEGGWVTVDGEVVDAPQFMVTGQSVQLDPGARLGPAEPATVLLHKPAGIETLGGEGASLALVTPASRSATDATGIRLLRRHFARLAAVLPLEEQASGLQPFTQDGRLLRRLAEEGDRIEQEFVVEVGGEIVPYGLKRLEHGLAYQGRNLPPAKVSWQSEARLRFAIKAVREGQIAAMCAEVGLAVLAMKRIRIGRVPLARLPAGEWRYLPGDERF